MGHKRCPWSPKMSATHREWPVVSHIGHNDSNRMLLVNLIQCCSHGELDLDGHCICQSQLYLGWTISEVTCHEMDPKGIFHMMVSPLWEKDKMLDEQRHLYSGCYYEKHHIVNSLCSHYIYQCRRNTTSRHSEWLVKQLPLLSQILAYFCK